MVYTFNYKNNSYINSICNVNLKNICTSWNYVNIKECLLNVKDCVLIKMVKRNEWKGNILLIGVSNGEKENCKFYIIGLSQNEAKIEVKNDDNKFEYKFNEMFVVHNSGKYVKIGELVLKAIYLYLIHEMWNINLIYVNDLWM